MYRTYQFKNTLDDELSAYEIENITLKSCRQTDIN
jgi:hypothetical protein